MDYQLHYNRLIERARHRVIEEYTERHHVIPRCMGGDNSKENLVDLTPEEHYVAHQLLVKMHPDHGGLAWAAIQMTGSSWATQRSNKLYGWLRRKFVNSVKQRTGDKNGSYGRVWYHNPTTLESGKFKQDEIPGGWVRGRKPVSEWCCDVCGSWIKSQTKRTTCSKACQQIRATQARQKTADKQRQQFMERQDEFFALISAGYSLGQSLREMGYGTSYSLKTGVGKYANDLLANIEVVYYES